MYAQLLFTFWNQFNIYQRYPVPTLSDAGTAGSVCTCLFSGNRSAEFYCFRPAITRQNFWCWRKNRTQQSLGLNIYHKEPIDSIMYCTQYSACTRSAYVSPLLNHCARRKPRVHSRNVYSSILYSAFGSIDFIKCIITVAPGEQWVVFYCSAREDTLSSKRNPQTCSGSH